MKRLGKKKWLVILVISVLAVSAAIAGLQFNQNGNAATEGEETSLQTTIVRRGDLLISTTGTGTLMAGREADLKFSVSGTVAELNVTVGEIVETGDVLAILEDVESLETDLLAKELALFEAQEAVANLEKNAAATLAEARLALVNAKDNYKDANANIKLQGVERCDETTLAAYYAEYIRMEEKFQEVGSGGTDDNYYLTVVYPLKLNRDKAYATYMYCAGYTDYEIEESQANLAIAEAEMNAAQKYVDLLTENQGIDPDELALAQNAQDGAQVAYNQAKKELDGATLEAPFAGTVMSIAGDEGEAVGTSTFITLADLANPKIELYIDETDMDKIAAGYEIEIVFDALPDLVFKGEVTSIEPALETSQGYTMVKAWANVDTTSKNQTLTLLEGMSATVEVIGGSTTDALLIPVDALRDLGDGDYAVFVVGDDGEPKLKMVEVGLMDYTYAEILNGLKQGDEVTTGIVETN